MSLINPALKINKDYLRNCDDEEDESDRSINWIYKITVQFQIINGNTKGSKIIDFKTVDTICINAIFTIDIPSASFQCPYDARLSELIISVITFTLSSS